MSTLRIIVNDAMNELHGWVQAGMEQRGKNATGATMRSVTISTVETAQFAQGTLSADSHWRYVGSGRGPGGMPPIGSIQAWIDAKGVDLNAWAVARTIAEKGSADFRQKNTNVFSDAADAWERLSLPGLDEKAGQYLEDAVVELSRSLERRIP